LAVANSSGSNLQRAVWKAAAIFANCFCAWLACTALLGAACAGSAAAPASSRLVIITEVRNVARQRDMDIGFLAWNVLWRKRV
jgi:hypothetical protein